MNPGFLLFFKLALAIEGQGCCRRKNSQVYMVSSVEKTVAPLEKTEAALQKTRPPFHQHPAWAQPTWLPGFTSLVVVTTLRLSSASTALRIMPWLSMPIILRGAKLATKRMRRPMSSSGCS